MHLLKTKYTSLLALPLLLVLCVFALPTQRVFAASTYTVNAIGDDPDATPGDSACETSTPGECTLRAAIEEVNAGSGGDTINFGIAGTGVHMLTPASGYPTISQSVTIDGYSQPGAVANTAPSPQPFNGTLTIEIDGTSAGGSSSGLYLNSSNITVKGLVINRFSQNGVRVGSANNLIISGNYIGTDPTGLINRGNAKDGVIDRDGASGTGNVIGGILPADRNIISGNIGAGLEIIENINLTVKGNYIGLAASGTAILPNTGTGVGNNNIYIAESTNGNIGGSNIADKNVISGSTGAGIALFNTAGMKIQGNYIGTNGAGQVQGGIGNTSIGVVLVGETQNTLVGGIDSGEGNVIAGNGSGVSVGDFLGSLLALNNSILGNSIHDNTGGVLTTLGIDLLGNSDNYGASWTAAGVTANDAGDTDVTSNVLMNFPVIQSVTSTNGQATITYSLDINDAEPGATGYRVEFFANDSADPSGHGQGQTFIGSDTLAGDVTGQQVTLTLPDGVDGSKYITATTTMTDASDDGFGHTSEFAENVQATLIAATEESNDGGPDSGGSSGSSSSSSSSTTSSDPLADTGQNTHPLILLSTILLTSGLAISAYALNKQRRKTYATLKK